MKEKKHKFKQWILCQSIIANYIHIEKRSQRRKRKNELLFYPEIQKNIRVNDFEPKKSPLNFTLKPKNPIESGEEDEMEHFIYLKRKT